MQLNFGASGTLLQQMSKGAPVDLFASADQATMDKAEKQDLIDPKTRHNFVQNTLVLIVPSDSTLTLSKLADLKKADVKKVAIGNPASVPVGAYTQATLEAAHLWKAVSAKAVNTQNVRQSLDYVARGEVDTGFVYGTDTYVMKDKVKTALEVPTQTPILYPAGHHEGRRPARGSPSLPGLHPGPRRPGSAGQVLLQEALRRQPPA